MNTLYPTHHRWRKSKNALVQVVTCCCALVVIVPLALIFYHVSEIRHRRRELGLLYQTAKNPSAKPAAGMANAIVGTLELLGLAALFGVPAGVLGGMFLSEAGSPD